MPSDQSNFPVIISSTHANWKTTGNGGHVSGFDGSDIIFTAADGTTILDHEIKTYVATTGEIIASVKIPTLSSSTDTDIYMYYGNASINDGLVGYWAMNDATSTVATDFSGNGNNGTLTNMAAPATATSGWGSGKLGGGLNFDGTDDYTAVPDSDSLDLTGDFTISFWLKLRSGATHSLYDGILAKMPGAPGWAVLYATGNKLRLWINNAGLVQTSSALVNDKWHHITFTKSSTQTQVFVDGVLDATGATANPTANSNELLIGRYVSSTYSLNGSLDEVRIYNRALSPTEITSLYEISTPENETVGSWSFEEGAGTVTADASGNGNHGTLMNSPTVTIGKVGQAMNFNESNTYITVPDHVSLQLTTKLSFSTWVYFTGNQANIDTVFMKNNSNSQYYGMYLSGNRAWLYTPTGGIATTPASIPSSTWTHIAMTLDSTLPNTNVKMYVNGVLNGTANHTTAIGSTVGQSLTIGRDSVNGRYFGGRIDELRLQNQILTADWITTEYNNQNSPPTFYSLSAEETPTTAPDAPTIGTATAGNAEATVTFTPPASSGGSTITGYTVTSSPGNITATGTASPITVTGLTNGTPYTFTVTATNAIGTSLASSASNSVTPAVPASWYNSSWTHRTKITIDHTKVPSDQSYFPVLISRTDANWKTTANG